jgi:hypothetical protein
MQQVPENGLIFGGGGYNTSFLGGRTATNEVGYTRLLSCTPWGNYGNGGALATVDLSLPLS